MKSLGGNGSIAAEAGVPIDQALGYVFSLPISTLVSGIDSEKLLDQNLKVVRNYKPMDEAARHALEQNYVQVAGDGLFELFNATTQFDGPVHRKQHGFEVAWTADESRMGAWAESHQNNGQSVRLDFEDGRREGGTHYSQDRLSLQFRRVGVSGSR